MFWDTFADTYMLVQIGHSWERRSTVRTDVIGRGRVRPFMMCEKSGFRYECTATSGNLTLDIDWFGVFWWEWGSWRLASPRCNRCVVEEIINSHSIVRMHSENVYNPFVSEMQCESSQNLGWMLNVLETMFWRIYKNELLKFSLQELETHSI